MRGLIRCGSLLAAVVSFWGTSPASADDADAFFDDSVVQEIRIWFDDPDWYDTLYNSHASDPEDPYFACRFESGDTVIDPCGVRMKGNSSFGVPTIKKSFKFDFDEFDEDNPDLHFVGIKKLSLNNSFKDPTMLREKLFHEFVSAYMPTIRVVHCRLYINDEYWGLYSAVEQVNKDFVQSRFGGGEDGNLYKCESSGGAGFGSNLSWIDDDPTSYWNTYELETNETDFDYSGLVEFIDALNNTSVADRPAAIEPLADVDAMLHAIALNCLFVNLDAYNGSAHNYYVYDRDDTGQFTHVFWDANEAFGSFRMGMPPSEDARELEAFWLPMAPPPGGAEPRPLMERLWDVNQYNRAYLRHLARFLREGFDMATFQPRITELADLIRADVYADINKQYSNADFEQNLVSDVGGGGGLVYGLESFIDHRALFLDAHLDGFASRSDLQLNELMSVNTTTMADEHGDFDPWIEVYNLGPGMVGTYNVYVTDDVGQPDKWQLPGESVDDGEFSVYWMDGESAEGPAHASFTLDASGGELHFYKKSGSTFTLIDSVTYPSLDEDVSWGRGYEEEADWEVNAEPTPGEANVRSLPDYEGVLFINEFMADNETTIADEAGEFEDWIELYNASEEDLDLGGLYMTDDLLEPTMWVIPDGTTIGAGGYLLIWADSDAEDGPLHADFKLGAGGEEIGLYAADGVTLIDSIVFGDQAEDVSMGRIPDGGDDWQYLSTPTPEAANVADPPEIPEIYVNELMADNETTIADEAGDFDDWFEIYNPGDEDIDLGGLFMTDDLSDPGAWQAPDGLIVPAEGFLLIWADDDAEEGDNHATFKFSAGGEEVAIYASDGVTLIDHFEFGAQEPDISYGRLIDGGPDLDYLSTATPGESNEGADPCSGDLDGDGTVGVDDLLSLIAVWGTPDGDIDGDGTTGVDDLLLLISLWGDC